MDLVVGMGEQKLTNQAAATLRTYALASCVAVTAHCPIRQAAGMVHVVLPSPLNEKDIEERPSYFAATGVPLLIRQMSWQFGCRPEQLVVQIYGGADSMWQNDVYNIGQANIVAVKKELQKLGVHIAKKDLSGSNSRSLAMDVTSGQVTVYRQPLMQINPLGRLGHVRV